MTSSRLWSVRFPLLAARRRWWPPLSFALTVVGIAFGLYYVVFLGYGRPDDLHAYFAIDLDDIYARPLAGTVDGYLYSPAFAQAFSPLTHLDFLTVELVWRSVLVVALAACAGPLTLPLMFFSPVTSEINVGNVHLLLAFAIAFGFRWPALWSFVLLTKVTPGIGLLWFAVRHEWRNLGIALAATAAIVTASVMLAPGAWPAWLASLARNGTADLNGGSFPVPLLVPVGIWFRLPLAALLVVFAARTNRRWLVPVAAFLALPVVWFASLSILVAAIRLRQHDVAQDSSVLRRDSDAQLVGPEHPAFVP